MHLMKFPFTGLAIAFSLAASPAWSVTLESAAEALGVAKIKTLEFSATGHWFQFGQAPKPGLPWPRFNVSRYTADFNFDTATERVQITRKQAVEPKRLRPTPIEQKIDQYISGGKAWSLAPQANAPQDSSPVATAQPLAVEERNAEIWSSPQGFIKAALANHATTKTGKDGITVSFSVDGKYHYVGIINHKNQVERVKTWIDNPVLGDTLVETEYANYKDFSGIPFPTYLLRTQGGHPVLELAVSEVNQNPALDIAIPENIASLPIPPISVTSNKLAEGVYYLTGGTHHSVAIEQKDHVVVVEAPLNEDRSLAVISKIKEIIPGKPIKYLVNTHVHFDHSGGLRTYVDEGASIVTQKLNQPYYQKAWIAPRTINPDHLAKSKLPVHYETFTGKKILSDGKRIIEIHEIAGNGHNDAFALVYLPAEKILVEADAFTPTAVNAPLPTSPNPYSVNLYQNIQKLNLQVEQIAPLHGRVVGLNDLRAAIGQQ